MYKLLLELSGLNVRTPSLEKIAEKHKVDVKTLRRQLSKGIKVEQEHTTDVKIAEEIALDHLNERPDYYQLLEKVEKD